MFVAQGDLTKLACDALLIPCDHNRNVSSFWADVLPADLPIDERTGWRRLNGRVDAAGVVQLPDSGFRRVRSFVALRHYAEPSDVVDRLWMALQHVADGLVHGEGRALPLIGIPLVGTGEGGLAHRRGEVIGELLERHRSERLDIDIALIVYERRDFAAVQERRNGGDWPDLGDALVAKADGLGVLAGNNELSLFLGSGVSRPVGLPDWNGLLEILRAEAGLDAEVGDSAREDLAARIIEKLGADQYHRKMRGLLDVDRYAVGHAFLANLKVNRMVTTNFDRCMETALARVTDGNFRVLARELANAGQPWLLKLNGDISRPDSIALSTSDFEKPERTALEGIVQSLLLTSHMLFVGFSLTEQRFIEIADAVTRARALASEGCETPTGTAVVLTPESVDRAMYKNLDMVPMLEQGTDNEAARMLEIFLDRLNWAAASTNNLRAEYLLDPHYETSLSEADRALRDLLNTVRNARGTATTSKGWERVVECLADLGVESSA